MGNYTEFAACVNLKPGEISEISINQIFLLNKRLRLYLSVGKTKQKILLIESLYKHALI